MNKAVKILLVIFLVLLAAAVSCFLTLRFAVSKAEVPAAVQEPVKEPAEPTAEQAALEAVARKMTEIEALLDVYYIDEYDPETVVAAAADGAASAMIAAVGDEWAYYVSADEMAEYTEDSNNSYVGIGVMIGLADLGISIEDVTKGSPAETAGIQVGDIISHVDGQNTVDLGIEGTQNIVRGEPGTVVHFTILRDGETFELDVVRAEIVDDVATARMLDNQIGYIEIYDFNAHCAEQTLACVDEMLAQGAKALLFDVRFNGGGYKVELVQILDALLPEGPLFRSVYYSGKEEVIESDARCVDLPMAVLVNDYTASAAEFFAAALQEYDAAEVVGSRTGGKGNFQFTMDLSDGSAIHISVGRYCTPKGVSLSDVGVTPDIALDLEYEEYANLYYGMLEPEDDDQLQAAVEVLLTKIS